MVRRAIAYAAAIASIFLGNGEAIAQTYQGQRVFRVGNNMMIVGNLAPGSQFWVEFPGARIRSLNLTADACGVASFRLPAGDAGMFVRVNGVNRPVSYDNIEPALVPPCINGQLAEARSQDFVNSGRYYIVGLAPGQPYRIEYPDVYSVRRTVNGCGFVAIRNNALLTFTPDTNFDIQTFNHASPDTFGALPDAGVTPRCFTVDGLPRLFIPTTW